VSIKSRQVAGVTTLVVLIVSALSAYHLATLARLSMQETASRGDLLKQAILQRAREVVPTAKDPYAALRQDGGIRSLLDSSFGYSLSVTYAAITNRDGVAVAHSDTSEEGRPLPPQEDISLVLQRSSWSLLRTVFRSDNTYEAQQPLLFGDQQFGTIRIGISTLLVKSELQSAFRLALQSVLVALVLSTVVAMLMAQWMLRPIHVIQSGLTRLGRGELDVRLDLPEEEFKDLGSSFAAVSAQLSESRAKSLTQGTDFESVVDNLEDAVALFSPEGRPMFCNPAMSSLLPDFASNETVRGLVDRTLASHKPQGPTTAHPEDARELMLITHPIDDGRGKFVGAMLVARNLSFMTQVHSTLNYSRKLAALGRLMAGVAHEVKNPLNAMTIHLELLKTKLARVTESVAAPALAGGADRDTPPPARVADVRKHVDIISNEIQRLDQVLNGFLRFARPDELKLQPTDLASVVSDVLTTIGPEAEAMRVLVKQECPVDLPRINADQAMLRQALLNLALNACQAMPDGGTLRVCCRTGSRARVEIDVEDTGVGIAPENLQKIFDLYFTTKERGSGIGLSMVYRIVQLHDGEVEVQSTPGSGTRFRLMFPAASQA
jgi:signal transduction histidine kinase/HAMP domain-containing protein